MAALAAVVLAAVVQVVVGKSRNMLKRDSLTAQMQQLSYILAKVKRLILEEREPEALNVTIDTLQSYYQFNEEDLILKSEESFLQLIRERGFQTEEINMLAYFLDEYAGLQETSKNQILLYKKLMMVYDFMEKELQFISFEHISRRAIIERQI